MIKEKEWHIAKIVGKIFNYKRLLKKPCTDEEKLLLALKREIHAHKKHIVFTEHIIERYEKLKGIKY